MGRGRELRHFCVPRAASAALEKIANRISIFWSMRRKVIFFFLQKKELRHYSLPENQAGEEEGRYITATVSHAATAVLVTSESLMKRRKCGTAKEGREATAQKTTTEERVEPRIPFSSDFYLTRLFVVKLLLKTMFLDPPADQLSRS